MRAAPIPSVDIKLMVGVWMFQLKPAVNTVIARSMLVLLTAPCSVIFSSPRVAVESNALDRMSGFPDLPNVSKAACLDIANPCEKHRLYRTLGPTNSGRKHALGLLPEFRFGTVWCDIDVQIDTIVVKRGVGCGTPRRRRSSMSV